MKKITIGSRGSNLALWQANYIRDRLIKLSPETKIEIKIIKTRGDLLQGPLADAGGKALFIKEIENELLDGEIDVAVHSMKDMPSIILEGTEITAIPERENPLDAFVSNKYSSPEEMPEGSTVGTGSPRRMLQFQKYFKAKCKEIRGNVETRLRKMDEGEFDAIILACAGLKRLKLESRITLAFNKKQMIPAPGQGALCIQCREEDNPINHLVKMLNDEKTSLAVSAERQFLQIMGYDCNVPAGCFVTIHNDEFSLASFIGDEMTGEYYEFFLTGLLKDISSAGKKSADNLRNQQDHAQQQS